VPPLLERAMALKPRAPRLRTIVALADAVQATGRPPPNLDLALAAGCAALELPIGMGPAIFAIGRSAGWVANVLEQQESPLVIWPRARFQRPAPHCLWNNAPEAPDAGLLRLGCRWANILLWANTLRLSNGHQAGTSARYVFQPTAPTSSHHIAPRGLWPL